MLSAWVDLIERGKVVALDPDVKREIYERLVGDDLRTEDSAPFDQQTLGAMELMSHSDPWETAMWTKQDLQDTLHAWHTLIEAIHERMPNTKSSPFISKGLFSAETLLAAGIRKNSFAWHFLRNAHKPAFDHLGPSLKLATDNDLINSVWKTARENFKPTPWHPSFEPVHEPGPFPVPSCSELRRRKTGTAGIPTVLSRRSILFPGVFTSTTRDMMLCSPKTQAVLSCPMIWAARVSL